MEQLVEKYAQKLIAAGLGMSKGICRPLVGGLDDTLVWNRPAPETILLEDIFKGLNINSLVFLRPAPPYSLILGFLAQRAIAAGKPITPKDCETRTFLHDLAVIPDFDPARIIRVLKKRKSVIVCPEQETETPAVIAIGTVSPEQGFVTVSSVAFACFVKFFADVLEQLRSGRADTAATALFDRVRPLLEPLKATVPGTLATPIESEEQVYSAIIEAGRQTVSHGLVDSYFGNVSFLRNNTLYISQTGSSLDELQGCIDPVPLDGSTSAGLTASSELSAHIETIKRSGCRAILHGHPKFSVILSMDCDPDEKAGCDFSNQCHIKCPKKRFIGTIPIVPGEVGTGPTGLCHTLPPALAASDSAIVYGHGLFTTGTRDFSQAFSSMLKAESQCRTRYFRTVDTLRAEMK